MELFHGSDHRIEHPIYGVGNPFNDYGLGFYCTESVELAYEWACPTQRDGVVNRYSLSTDGLTLYRFDDGPNGTLPWLATLVRHRSFEATTPLMAEAMEFISDFYPPALDDADYVIGYRADDSYFSFARAFLDNRISQSNLEEALLLGDLGHQVMLKSAKAFSCVEFTGSSPAFWTTWHSRRLSRDQKARSAYRERIEGGSFSRDDVFILDLMREAQ